MKNILFFLVMVLTIACGKSIPHNNTPALLSRQLSHGIPTDYLKKNELVSNLKRHQLILDTDGDNLLDKDDPDIDNDGVPNDCDLSPFDKTQGNSDLDNDGIPDFCDLNPRSDKVSDNTKAIFQKNIFTERGFILFEDNIIISELDFPFILNLIEKISLKSSMPSKQLYTIASTSNLAPGEYGSYDSSWANIRYMHNNENSEEFPSIKLWQWVLTHEFFHFVAATNLNYYSSFHTEYVENFKNETLTYPTVHSRQGEGEYFAELETSLYFNL